jgi:hypothetical protein
MLIYSIQYGQKYLEVENIGVEKEEQRQDLQNEA